MNPSIMERGVKIDYDTSNTSSVQERRVIFHGIHSVRRYLFWLSLTLTSLRTSLILYVLEATNCGHGIPYRTVYRTSSPKDWPLENRRVDVDPGINLICRNHQRFVNNAREGEPQWAFVMRNGGQSTY